MFKCDYSHWYRWFRVDPGQAVFFAVAWNGALYIDACLSFENRAAVLCAQRVMWSVLWIFRTKIDPQPDVRNYGIYCLCPSHCDCGDITCAGYIDDTLVIVPQHTATHQYNVFDALCGKLGLRLSRSPGHMSPPATKCVTLGLLYDLEAITRSSLIDTFESTVNIYLVCRTFKLYNYLKYYKTFTLKYIVKRRLGVNWFWPSL